jgi:hypothetical protein
VLHIEEATYGVFVITRRQLSALQCNKLVAASQRNEHSRAAKARNAKTFIVKAEQKSETRRVHVLDEFKDDSTKQFLYFTPSHGHMFKIITSQYQY